MSEICKLVLLERAAIQATAWHWGNIDFANAEADIRRGSAEFAESLGKTLGFNLAVDTIVADEAVKKLDYELTEHIEQVVKASFERAQSEAQEEQLSHISLMTKLQEHARKSVALLRELSSEDPTSFESFRKITEDFDREILVRVQDFHVATLEFIFSQTMAEKETIVELAKLYEVSLELGLVVESA